jgi:plastocyanin
MVGLAASIACAPATHHAPKSAGAPVAGNPAVAQPAAANAAAAQPTAAQPAAAKPAAQVSSATTIQLTEKSIAFLPNSITVKAGTKVRLVVKNEDTVDHNVVGKDFELPANQQKPRATETIEWTTTEPGTYQRSAPSTCPA